MRQIFWALGIAALAAPWAHAGHIGLGGFGGPGFGGHRGGGGRGFDVESQQARYEDRFADLMIDYDTGLAEIDDFYNSDEYTDIVDDTESLADRYGLFLSGIERTIAHLDDFLATLNEDLAYYQDLLTEYQERDDLSEERLARIETRLTNIQDHLTGKIELLTEKQATLTENFGSYETFATDLSAWLDEIVAAGGGTIEEDDSGTAAYASTAALAALAEPAVPLAASMEMCEVPESAAAATAVPEPGMRVLVALSVAGVLSLRRPRCDRHRR